MEREERNLKYLFDLLVFWHRLGNTEREYQIRQEIEQLKKKGVQV